MNANPSHVAIGRWTRVAEADSEHFEETLVRAFPKVMFALVPLFAALVLVVYRNSSWHYPAYLYFSLHLHAAVFGFLLLTLPLQPFAADRWITLAQAIVLLASFVYLVTALQRVFGGRRLQVLLRGFAVSSAYLASFAAAVELLVVLLFYRLGVPGSE